MENQTDWLCVRKECLAVGTQRFDHQQKRTSLRQLKKVAFLYKAKTLVKAFDVGSAIAPDFCRQWLCASVLNERLKDGAAHAASSCVFLNGHAANTPADRLRGIFARLRYN